MKFVTVLILVASMVIITSSLPHGRSKRAILSATENYLIFTEKATWAEARQQCESYYGELAKLPSLSLTDITAMLLAYAIQLVHDDGTPISHLYIGLNDLNTDGDFRYTDNAIPDANNWAYGQPNDNAGSEECVIINISDQGKWYVVDCEQTHAFLCYVDPLSAALWLPRDGKLYKYLNSWKTWHGASEECQSNGGSLVKVANESMLTFLREIVLDDRIENTKPIWIDINDIDTEDDWRHSDGEPLVFDHWAIGQPDNGMLSSMEEDCAHMDIQDDVMWYDTHCDNMRAYLCEYNQEVSYRVVLQMMSWQDAQNYCVSEGGHLARMRSEPEYVLFVLLRMQAGIDTDYWWIDGNDMDVGGEFVYSNNWPVHFLRWHYLHVLDVIQDSNSKNCLYTAHDNSFVQSAGDCNEEHYFVCQFGDEAWYTTDADTTEATTTSTTTLSGQWTDGTNAFPITINISHKIVDGTLETITTVPTTRTYEETVKEESKNSLVPIIGGVVGGLLALCVVIGGVVLIKKLTKRDDNSVNPKERPR